MAHGFTVDASVFLRAFNPREVGHEEGKRFFERARDEALPLIEPALLLPEIGAGPARGWDDTALAEALVGAIQQVPHRTLVPIDPDLANAAAVLAARRRLRGSDAIYAAVALEYGTTLVTLDQQHLTRLGRLLPVGTPAQVLTNWGR